MKTFLIDGEVAFAYDLLLTDVINTDFYYPQYRTNELYACFVNLIVALIHNESITLLDSDLTDSEIQELKLDHVNEATSILPLSVDTMSDIVHRITSSTSEITLFTSGTTGQPKQIKHSIDTLTKAARISDVHADDIWGFAFNPTHIAGVQVFLQAILNQNTLVNLFNASRNVIFDSFHKYRVTHLSATPTFYRLLLPTDKSFDFLKRISIGGEKSDQKLHNQLTSVFPNAKLNNIYASTEAGNLLASHGDNFQIPENLKHLISINKQELLIHKSLLGKASEFDLEFYSTGDLIEWINEEQGIFRFAARRNNLLSIGGYKVNPTEIESFIMQISGIQQVLVYCKPNSILGNMLYADVQLSEGSNLSELDIRRYCKEHLQDYKVPRLIKFVDDISVTRTGKLKRV
jgi:acyl-coenzyme A synthetase/AMP-(fatty) acid ligase